MNVLGIIEGFARSTNQKTTENRYSWGDKFLPKVLKKKNKTSPGQMKLPWATWEVVDSEIRQVDEKFVNANCYDPKVVIK